MAEQQRDLASAAAPALSARSALGTPRAIEPAADADGWHARLQLRFASLEGRTRLARCEHTGPLRLQRLFYPESPRGAATASVTALSRGVPLPLAEPCHAYLLHPPGGLVGGDELRVEADVMARAHALLTTPAAAKFYRRRGARTARALQSLRVSGGVLEWLPQENIYYPDTDAEVRTCVRLRHGARFIGWEIHSIGWPATGATLGGGCVRSSLELWLDEQPLLLERLALDQSCLAPRWGLAGYTCCGSWIAYPARARERELAAACVMPLDCAEMTLACTIVDGALCCRGLALRADRLKAAFVELWRTLRPVLLGRSAVAPRIWAT